VRTGIGVLLDVPTPLPYRPRHLPNHPTTKINRKLLHDPRPVSPDSATNNILLILEPAHTIEA
jgi:hypothetical protein